MTALCKLGLRLAKDCSEGPAGYANKFPTTRLKTGQNQIGHPGTRPVTLSATILARGEHVDIIELLKAERDKAAQQVNVLDTAIRALIEQPRVSHGPRKMSVTASARISASQKARWARARGQKVGSIAPNRHISPAGLARIRAAARARWAKVSAAQK
jgi:hypothetical protein